MKFLLLCVSTALPSFVGAFSQLSVQNQASSSTALLAERQGLTARRDILTSAAIAVGGFGLVPFASNAAVSLKNGAHRVFCFQRRRFLLTDPVL